MLNYLHIENIAVIEQTELELLGGFNVLTGETGAGKSIVIDAINTVLGARTSRDIIRSGYNNASVMAEFSNIGQQALEKLSENGYSVDENGNLVLLRRLSSDGKAVFRINGQPASAAVIRDIGRHLINIHGQHDNQALLDPERHCDYLDKIAENGVLLSDYYNEFKTLNAYRRELKELETDEDAKARKIDLLQFQISEIADAGIQIGEYEVLKEKLKIARDLESNLKLLNGAYILLSGSENPGATELLNSSLNSLLKVDFKGIEALSDRLSEISQDVVDVAADLRNLIDNEINGEYNLDEIQDRLDLLRSLMLKYGNSEQAILDYYNNATDEIEKIKFSDERARELEELLLNSQEQLINKGRALTESRVAAAKKIEDQVCEILRNLDMPQVKFCVKIEQGRYTKRGCDVCEFMISANVGEEIKPLAKIASGGELSRIMLAIKSVLSDKDEVDTLIFDEIDTGISGRAANKVAFQLKNVAAGRQVICVTHLAQIAACASNHLLIEKSVNEGRTFTTVNSLSYEQRINEIARIMSGTEMTEKTYNSAKELLDRSL